MVIEFERALHINFFKSSYKLLPQPYSSQDYFRLSLSYFVISALDLLDSLEVVNREETINWIYSLQLIPAPDQTDSTEQQETCGFRGSSWVGHPYSPEGHEKKHQYDTSHIAMTYTALAILKILGDDLSRVNKKAVISSLKKLQLPDGSFCPSIGGAEADMRFVFCATAISHFLDDWSGIDLDLMVNFILRSQSYDAGLAQSPGGESHGGSTYCALAALTLAKKLDQLPHQQELVEWCLERQLTGFQGRINKDPDTCYSWWIGGSLSLLDSFHFVDWELNSGFILGCQKKIGGFGKSPDTYPDVLHSYYSLASLSMMGMYDLRPLDFRLGISKRASQQN